MLSFKRSRMRPGFSCWVILVGSDPFLDRVGSRLSAFSVPPPAKDTLDVAWL